MRLLVALSVAACHPEPVAAPATLEVCNGIDDDADGVADEPFDADLDGYASCGDPAYVDCDDRDRTAHPFGTEICDGIDNDCDGVVPMSERDLDGDGALTCDLDCDDTADSLDPFDRDADGWSTCAGDCDDAAPDVHPAAVERCDGLDGDCDGVVPGDELDADRDGQPICDGDCDDEDPLVENLDRDQDGHGTCGGLDCDDLDPTVHGEECP